MPCHAIPCQVFKETRRYGQYIFNNTRWIEIINSLHDLNMPVQIINLVRSSLTYRQITSTYGRSTVSKNLSKSCPQGSALSPLLLKRSPQLTITFFNMPNSKMIAFANDISVILWRRNAKSLHRQFKRSITFIHNLELSAAKTRILNLHRNMSSRSNSKGQLFSKLKK